MEKGGSHHSNWEYRYHTDTYTDIVKWEISRGEYDNGRNEYISKV